MGTEKEEERQIELGRLLRLDMRHLTWLPCLMIFVVVVNVSVSITILEINVLSYLALSIVMLSSFFMAFLYLRRGAMSWFVLLAIVFQLLLLTFTIINATDLKNCFYQSCSIAFIVMACDYYKDRYEMILCAFAIAFSFCVYLNFYHLVTHSELWIIDDLKTNKGYLLGGNYNQMGSRLLCAVGTSIVCLKFSRKWLFNTIPVILISIVTLTIVGSMTSLTGIILFLLFCLIPSHKLLKTGIVTLMVTVILFQVFVCFQGNALGQNELAIYFIEDVLGKDITFTNRTLLWDAALKIFMESPLFGYGFVGGDWYYSHLSSLALGPHNFIWMIIIQGGIILLALFTYICYLAYVKLSATNDRHVLRLYAVMSVLFMMMTMESYPLPLIFILLSLVFFAPKPVPEPIIKNTIPE